MRKLSVNDTYYSEKQKKEIGLKKIIEKKQGIQQPLQPRNQQA